MDNTDFKIEIHLQECTDAIYNAVVDALEESIGELESQVKRNTKVDTGKTKGSWEHLIDGETFTAYVGSNYQNAIWEEFGTGIYALEGNGRKDPWVYSPDGGGTFYRTCGKKPRRALYNAMNTMKPLIERYFKERLRNL